MLNASLAGGVDSSADLSLHPYGGLLVGLAARLVSTLGYNQLMPFLLKKAKFCQQSYRHAWTYRWIYLCDSG